MGTKKVIHIVGAGFAGLSLACYLSDHSSSVKNNLEDTASNSSQTNHFANLDIHIYEKSSRIGGLIYSRIENGNLIESGAQSIILNDLTKSFLEKINCHFVTALPTAKKRFFYRSQLTQWPLTFLETLICLPKALKLVLFKKYQPLKKESIANWISRILTPAVSKYIVSPALQGIYAHSADQLSAEMIFKSLTQRKKRKKYKGIISGIGGTFDIIKAAHNYIIEKGGTVHLNTAYTAELAQQADYIIIATSAQDAAGIASFTNPALVQEIQKIDMSDIYSSTAIFKDKPLKYQGFGALIPSDQKLIPMGVLFNSDVFPNRSSSSSETFISKEKLNPAEIEKTHECLFKASGQLLNIYHDEHSKRLPIYNVNLFEFNQKYRQEKNIYLHGNYLGGIGLSQILERSVEISTEIKERSKFVGKI